MTKVLRIITRLNIGGPALHVTNLNYYLDKEYGYDSTLLYGSLAEGEGSMEYLAKNKNLKTIVFPALGRELSPLNDLKIIWKLFWLIKKEKPDIVHTHTAKAGLSGRIAAKLAGVKKIYHTFHGNIFNGYFSGLKTKIFILLEQFCGLLSTEIIAISEEQKKDLIKYKIVPISKITVIPLGFELARFKLDPQQKYLRKLLQLSDSVKLVGIVGRLVPIKNHAYFIDIAERVLKKNDNVRFLLIGDGELKEELTALITAKGLQQRIFITGFINEVEQIYSDLDIVALTSKNEGTPVTLIEALACGKPVISTDVGGVKDILQHGQYGWLEKQNDADKYAADILTMLDNYQEALSKAKAGQQYILTNYDVDVLSKNINCLYTNSLK